MSKMSQVRVTICTTAQKRKQNSAGLNRLNRAKTTIRRYELERCAIRPASAGWRSVAGLCGGCFHHDVARLPGDQPGSRDAYSPALAAGGPPRRWKAAQAGGH